MTILEIIQNLKTGNKEEIRQAQKAIEKIWYQRKNRKEFETLLLGGIRDFDKIKKLPNKLGFILALKLPLLKLGFKHYELCRDFILKLLEDENGNIRQQAGYTGDYLFMAFRPSYFETKSKKILEKNKRLEEKFTLLMKSLFKLAHEYSYQARGRKFINRLSPCVFKSIQLLIGRQLVGDYNRNILLQHNLKFYPEYFDEYYWEFDGYHDDLEPSDKTPIYSLVKDKKWDLYYDAIECLSIGDTVTAKELLQKAVKLEPDFVAGYMGLTASYKVDRNNKKEKGYANLAFKKTRQIFPKWPRKMIWGELENRQYLRAIFDKAAVFHKEGQKKEAEKLYRLILKLNPNDNQGIRYLLAGMFAGISPENVDALFDEGNKLQDWSKLETMLYQENKKHNFWHPPNNY